MPWRRFQRECSEVVLGGTDICLCIFKKWNQNLPLVGSSSLKFRQKELSSDGDVSVRASNILDTTAFRE